MSDDRELFIPTADGFVLSPLTLGELMRRVNDWICWERDALVAALFHYYDPVTRPGDAPHGVNAEGETDWC